MLEKECIQSRGFKNTVDETGDVTGFQFDIRLMYYRGLWLSQIHSLAVEVDGETVPPEAVAWEIAGVLYQQEEMKDIGDVHWNVLEPATIRVAKAQGLKTGYHEIGVDLRFGSSYMPPSMDEVLSYGSHQRKLLMV